MNRKPKNALLYQAHQRPSDHWRVIARHLLLLVATVYTSVVLSQSPGQSPNQTVVGHLNSDFSVDQGAVSYTIPIAVPSGRAGMQPELSFQYHSNGGDGLMGIGWHLGGLSAIHRCPATLAQEGRVSNGLWYDSPFCLDGERLVPITHPDGRVEYRTEIDSYAKITAHGGGDSEPEYWRVHTKAGQVMTYGLGLHTTVNHNGIMSWSVSEINDTTGSNAIRYRYATNNGNQRLQSIQYSGGIIEMVYGYPRRDQKQQYRNGREVSMGSWLSGIRIYNFATVSERDKVLVGEYTLRYGQTDDFLQLLELHYCDAQQNCFQSERFEWQASALPSRDNPILNNGPNTNEANVYFGDFDGNGITDYILHDYRLNGGVFELWLGQTSGVFQRADWTLSGSTNPNTQFYFIDHDSDGFTDYIQHNPQDNNGQFVVWTNQKNGRFAVSPWQGGGSTLNNTQFYFNDYNGDSLVDYIAHHHDVDQGRFQVWLGDGRGGFSQAWAGGGTLGVPGTWTANNGPQGPAIHSRFHFIDLDGDGRTDYLHRRYNNQHSNDSGLMERWYAQADGSFIKACCDPPARGANLNHYFADFNGDNISDYATYSPHEDNGQISVYLGNGWGEFTRTWQGGGSTDQATQLYFVDVNHDGLSDYLQHSPTAHNGELRLWLASGDGTFIEHTSWRGPGSTAADTQWYPGDYNGDHHLDYILYSPGDALGNGGNGDSHFRTYLNSSQGKALSITRFEHSNGTATDVTYQPLTHPDVYRRGEAAETDDNRFPVATLQTAQYVVSEVQSDNGVGGSNTVRYRYQGLKAHLQGRGSMGFARITEHYPDTLKTTVTDFDHSGFPLLGNILKVTEWYGEGSSQHILNESTHRYRSTQYPEGYWQVALHSRTDHSYELGDGSHPVTTVTRQYDDIDPYGHVGRVTVTTEAQGQRFSQTTVSDYQALDPNRWLLGRLLETAVTHQSPGMEPVVRRSSFRYETHTGLLQSEAITNAAGTETLTETHYRHDRLGRKISVQTLGNYGHSHHESEPEQALERTTITTYRSSSNPRPTRRCNALALCTAFTYTPEGWLASRSDSKGLTTQWTRDGFGRIIREDRPDGTWTTIQRHFASSGHCGELAPHARTCTLTQQAGSGPSIVQLDALGRDVRKITTGFAGRLVYRDTEYNAQAHVSRISRDYYEGRQIYWAQSEYDALGRVVRMTEPDPYGTDNEILTDYQGLVTTVRSGPEQRTKTTTTNALGQTLRIDEEMGTYTEYTYSSDGNLLTTRVAGDDATLIRLHYDEFGRKIAMDDPDMGTWQYRYNGFGELIWQRDAKGQEVTIRYDALGRMIRRTEPEGTSTWTYFDHQAPVGSRGQLAHEATAGIQRHLTYDNLGRVTSAVTAIDTETFTTRFTYDELGRLQRTLYPGSQGSWTENFWTENSYDQYGFLRAVQGARSQGQAHNSEAVRRLINQGLDLAQAYLDQAQVLQQRADYYQALSDEIAAHLTNETLDTSLQHALTEQWQRLQSLHQRLVQHIEADTATAEQLLTLSEFTLAAVDHSYQLANTADYAADIYQDLLAEADRERISYWRVADVDASGRISADVYGNGIVNDYAYNQATGQLLGIHSSLLATEALRQVNYQYDAYQNVTQRSDLVNDIHEHYTYDRLDRLVSTTVNSHLYDLPEFNHSQTQQFDVLGNITDKSDVGHYLYGQHGAGPHAVTQAGDNTYRYDANGNTLSGADRQYQWSSFNKPTRMTRGEAWSRFQYDMNRARYQKTNHHGDTTLYIGKLYEQRTSADGNTEQKHYIYAGGQLIAEHVVATEQSPQTRYLHQDALGSIDLVTDAYANVVDRRSYDPWGKLRNLPWQYQASLNDPLHITQLALTTRGYTGHEHVPEVDLIHMGGRVYDPHLARFISADPHIQAGSLSQSYNRYSYVINNPLKYNDPSGYFFKKLFSGIKKAVKNLGRGIKRALKNPAVLATLAIATGFYAGKWALQAFGSKITAGAVGGFAGGLVGSRGDVEAALVGAFTGAAAGWIGMQSWSVADKAFAHGVTGGTASVVRGGKFGYGFASSFFTKMVSKPIQGLAENAGAMREIAGATAAALVGGTASAIGGGKFANGAQTAAIQYLFNQAASKRRLLRKEYRNRERKTFSEQLGVDYSLGTYTGGSAITPGGGINLGANGQFFSDGSSDSYGVVGAGWGWDVGGGAETNFAIYLGEGSGNAASWSGRFDSYHISAFGFTASYFYGGGWHGLSFGASTDGLGASHQINEYHSLTGN